MSGDRLVRIAVVGAGYLGRHHARILVGLPGVELIAIADTNAKRAEETADKVGVSATTDFNELFGQVEAVTLAVPTDVHRNVAIPFLERGVSVLVEKPIARLVSEADEMISAALKSKATLMVGHTERYNPATDVALPLAKNPRFIEVHRLGVFTARSLDIDVVFDLMIHDLDVVLAMVQSEVMAIEAVGVPVLTGKVDIANARIRFKSGCIANLTASRISCDRVRKIRFFQPDGYISIDYIKQEVESWRLVRTDNNKPSIEGGKLDVSLEEPLREELADFVRAIRSGTNPRVTGEDGRQALVLAQQVADAMVGTL